MAEPGRDRSLEARVAAALEAVAGEPRIAIGVSGGGDSMALLHLALDWARPRGIAVEALTVDHGLRPESAAEAASVALACAALDLPHRILHWQKHPGSGGNLSALARQARYKLMVEASAGSGATVLLTGHTRDDQAETVLMRLARGSGVDGLAGIAVETRRDGLRILRPLLDASRDELRHWLRARGIAWADDPTNDDPRYDRVKARQMQATLGDLGMTAERLAATARMMAEARVVLERAADALQAKAVAPSPLGYFRLDRAGFAAADRETGLRLLTRLMRLVSGAPYRARLEGVSGLHAMLCGEAQRGGATLQGCQLVLEGEAAFLCREVAACPPPCALAEAPAVWDARFEVEILAEEIGERPGVCEGVTLAPLGERGWHQIASRPGLDLEILRTAPLVARFGLPALWCNDDVLAVPSVDLAVTGLLHGCVIRPLMPFSGGGVEPEAYIFIQMTSAYTLDADFRRLL